MKRIAICLIIFCLVLVFSPLRAATGASYYAGKTIRIVVGSAPGGGYDRMARLLSKHLSRHIPGNPVFIVDNMPGANSMIAANYIYNAAKPNGLTIGTFNQGIPLAQLMKAEGVRFDVTKYAWIGSAAVESTVLTLRSDLPFRTVADLLKAKEPIILGTSGPAGQNHQFISLLKEFAGFNFKIAIYPSSASTALAVETKEIDGLGGAFSSLKPNIDRGLLRPWIRSRAIQPETANLPADEDLTTNAMGKSIMAMRAATDQVGRPYVAPPGTPAPVMKTLRDAFAAVAKDPALQEDAKRTKMGVYYLTADECLQIFKNVLNQPPEIVREAGKYIRFL